MQEEQMTLLDFLPEESPLNEYLKPISSTDWKWEFKDYPPQNGLKVFSCFAGGADLLWATN